MFWCLNYRDLTLYIKKTRKQNPFRYFAVGEYGDLTQRPHYHIAIFPSSSAPHTSYLERWQLGHSSIFEINPQRASYIAGYTVKKYNKKHMQKNGDDRTPESARMSTNPGIGYDFAMRIAEKYKTKTGELLLATHGDIELQWQTEGKNWPIGSYGTKKIREKLGIQILDADRRLAVCVSCRGVDY